VRLLADIGHCIECEAHVESLLVGLARRRLDATGGHHSGHNHLGNASRLELTFKIRCCECAPTSLGDDDIARLLIQLRQEVGPALGKRCAAAWTLFRPAWRPSRHIDQHDWEFLRTKNIDQRPRPVDDLADGMDEMPIDYAFLQADHNQRAAGIKSGKRHRVLLLEYKVDVGKKQGRAGLILNKPGQQFDRCLKLLLLVSRKLLRDGRCEPVLPRGPALMKPLQAFGRERHQSLPSVAWVRSTTHQADFLQGHNDRAHGLRTHAFRSRQT